jgi:hypothetical protein
MDPGNRGLYVAAGATIPPGAIYEVKISFMLEFPEPESSDIGSIGLWESDIDTEISKWIKNGAYVIPLDADNIRDDEPLIFKSSPKAVPMERTCREVRRAVRISTREPLSYAAMKTNDSPFNLMNDAAYVDGCGKEEYLKRVSEGVNHAEFVMGIGPDGVHDRLYMRFYQGASGGDEVFATYGWHYW